MCHAQYHDHHSVSAQINNQVKHVFVLGHQLPNSDIALVGHVGVGTQKIRGNHTVDDVNYVDIQETHTVDLFEPSSVAQ